MNLIRTKVKIIKSTANFHTKMTHKTKNKLQKVNMMIVLKVKVILKYRFPLKINKLHQNKLKQFENKLNLHMKKIKKIIKVSIL